VKIADVDLRLLRVFRTVVDQGGFAGAELALDKGKSAISMDIAHLEQRLGARLCRRGRGGFALTEQGEAVHLAAVQLLDDLDRFRDRVAAATGRLTGRLTLMVVDNIVSIASPPLTDALGVWARRHPEVRLVLESAPARVVAQATEPLFNEEMRLYCGAAHPLFAVAAPTPAQIHGHALVRPSAMDDAEFARLVAAFAPGAQADAVDARILLVLSGAYLAFLPVEYARPWHARGALRELLPDQFSGENTFHLLSRPGQTAAAAALRAIMLEAFGRLPVPPPASPRSR